MYIEVDDICLMGLFLEKYNQECVEQFIQNWEQILFGDDARMYYDAYFSKETVIRKLERELLNEYK